MRALLLATLLIPTADPLVDPRPYTLTPRVSTDMLDGQTLTRFQLTSRITFAKPDAFNRTASTLSHELRANLTVAENFSLGLTLPVGQLQPGVDGSRDAYVGNVALGATWATPLTDEGGADDVTILLATGLDLYAPSAADSRNDALTAARGLVAAIRGYDVQLYIPRFAGARARAQVGVTLGDLHAALELGLTPGATTSKPGAFIMLVGGSARVSYTIDRVVEPYLEAGGARQIAGDGDVDPPFLVTPGVRFHIADFFDPAIFASFNFIDAGALVIGIDLAFALRPTHQASRDSEEIELDDIGEFGDFDF